MNCVKLMERIDENETRINMLEQNKSQFIDVYVLLVQ